jgi:hypothetical protein
MNQLQNNTSQICVFIKDHAYKWIVSYFICIKHDSKAKVLQRIHYKTIPSESVFLSGYKCTGYEVSYQIDSVLIPHAPFVYNNLLCITHQ